MSNNLFIYPDSSKVYTINNIEDYNYYKSLRPVKIWNRVKIEFKCECCGKTTTKLLMFIKPTLYCRNCQLKISAKGKDGISANEKRKKTCLERYGVENTFQSPEKKEKIKQTCMERYGYENAAQVPTIKEKAKRNNLEKYGVTCTLNTEENIKKKKATWIEHYGVDNPNKSSLIREKTKQTNIEKYGADYYLQTEECKHRSMATKLEKYGDAFYSSLVLYHYDNIFFRSKPEVCFYIYNRDCGKKVVYEPMPYIKYMCENKEYYYKPDFLIENTLYEIKGDYFFDENGNLINPYNRDSDNVARAKQKCMKEHNVIVLKSEKYNFYIDYVNSKYGTDYIEKFRYKKED